MKVSLKDFVKTDAFKALPTVNGHHFMNGGCLSDVYPYIIVETTKTGKTVKVARLDSKVISGSMQDGSAEYEYYVNLDEDGKLVAISTALKCRDELYKNDPDMFALKGCKLWKMVATDHPRYYYDPHF